MQRLILNACRRMEASRDPASEVIETYEVLKVLDNIGHWENGGIRRWAERVPDKPWRWRRSFKISFYRALNGLEERGLLKWERGKKGHPGEIIWSTKTSLSVD
jgi:hypothetical protein